MRGAPLRTVLVTRRRVTDGARKSDAVIGAVAAVPDDVVTEEPLEIRLAGDPLAITMRTPGADRELVIGFLWAEGMITSLADIAAIAPCQEAKSQVATSQEATSATAGSAAQDSYATASEPSDNCIDITPSDRMRLSLSTRIGLRRGSMTTSACGVCGRRTIEDLLARCTPLAFTTTMAAAALARGTEQLRLAQPLFARSGGCHGAALVDQHGNLVCAYEDVGRHNAVDKVIGARLLAGASTTCAGGDCNGRSSVLPAGGGALIVSGRTSFEIVQKAVAAGIEIVAGISAASSLAIDTAQRAGITLAGFVRNNELVIYTHAGRIASKDAPNYPT